MSLQYSSIAATFGKKNDQRTMSYAVNHFFRPTITSLQVFIILVMSSSLFAQGWERVYPEGATIDKVIVASNGDFLCLGTPMQLKRVSPDGQLLWSKNILPVPLGQLSGAFAINIAMIAMPSGGYLAAQQVISSGTDNQVELLLVKVDEQGNIEWFNSIEEEHLVMVRYGDIVASPDGGFLLAGTIDRDTTFLVNYDAACIKFDAAGNEQWRRYYAIETGDRATAQRIIALSDGNYALLGRYSATGSASGSFLLIKTDPVGEIIWQQVLGEAWLPTELIFPALGLLELADGSFCLAGPAPIGFSLFRSINMLSVSAEGQLLSQQQIILDGSLTLAELTHNSAGGWAMATTFTDINNGQGDLLVWNYTSDGQLIWRRSFGGLLSDNARDIIGLPDGGFVLSGSKGVWEQVGSSQHLSNDEYLLRLDNTGQTYAQRLAGKVYHAADDICSNPIGTGLRGWLVTAEGNGTTYYALTDSTGHFNLSVAEGVYTLVVTPNNAYWQMCEPVGEIAVNPYDSIYTLLPATAVIDCPWLETDISTPLLRRCFDNTYTVTYANRGTTAAQDAYIEVELDPYLQFNFSTISPSAQNGNMYQFYLGNLAPGDEGAFQINVTVNCDSTLIGQTHCASAHIYPDAYCLSTPNWNGASIEVDATCTGDSIIFYIQNVSELPTGQPLPFHVIEDQVILLQGNFNLGPMGIRQIKLPADGGTFRLEAAQVPQHPGNSMPSITVEGCGPTGPTSLGYATQLPEDDADPFISIDCQENVGSWDPNDKRGYPKGYGESRYIAPNTDIEYLIRFQNTGTDTAFTVVVRDAISPHLDINTLRPGASSHPYELQMGPDGMLEFHFKNIALPDSNVNEAASHGFVKFRVSQLRDNTPGTTIYNAAAIYFDYNLPVITNTTKHIVQVNFIEIDLLPLPGWSPGSIIVAPNPINGTATIDVPEAAAGASIYFEVFDAAGHLVRREKTTALPFVFERGNLPAGVYFCKLLVDGALIGQGKLVAP